MPLQPSVTQIRLNNIITSLNAAVTTLEVISKLLTTPFLQPILNTVKSLLTSAEVGFGKIFLTESHALLADGKEQQR
jgi:hypothetical protein